MKRWSDVSAMYHVFLYNVFFATNKKTHVPFQHCPKPASLIPPEVDLSEREFSTEVFNVNLLSTWRRQKYDPDDIYSPVN